MTAFFQRGICRMHTHRNHHRGDKRLYEKNVLFYFFFKLFICFCIFCFGCVYDEEQIKMQPKQMLRAFTKIIYVVYVFFESLLFVLCVHTVNNCLLFLFHTVFFKVFFFTISQFNLWVKRSIVLSDFFVSFRSTIQISNT